MRMLQHIIIIYMYLYYTDFQLKHTGTTNDFLPRIGTGIRIGT